jgi:multiple sugar transport system substrate-binding protein
MSRLKTALGSVLAFAIFGASAGFAETTLRMWTFLDPAKTGGREQALKTMIDKFEQQNPGVKIKVEPQVWTTLAEKFVLGHNAGNAPDIGWVNSENLGIVLNTDAAADLGNLIVSKWSSQRKADLLMPGMLEGATVKGKVLAIPIMASTWVLMYRKDLLREAGLTPDQLRTWDGVTQAAIKMTRPADSARPPIWGIGLGLSQERYSVTPSFLAALEAQGSLFDASCNAKMTGPGVERAINMQADWINKDKVVPREALSMSSDDAIDQLAAGRYAMQFIANSRFEQIQRTAAGWNKDELALAPIPGWTAEKPGPIIISGWSAVAWSKSPNLQLAAKFIDFMTDGDAMALWTSPGGQLPLVKSVAEGPLMQDPKNAPGKMTAEFMSKTGKMMPGNCNWARTLSDFNLATQQLVLGQKTAAEAMKQAEKATQDRQ